ncbi:primosomal protein N' [bacterium]|nr:primosomal protein N' [bacterium]
MAEYAHVAIPIPYSKPFTYRIPEKFESVVKVGSRVVVPLLRGGRIGFVVKLLDIPDYDSPKPIWDVVDNTPLFDESILSLYQEVAEEYFCSLGEVIKAAIPSGTQVGLRKKITLLKLPDQKFDKITDRILQVLKDESCLYLTSLQKKVNKSYINYYLNLLEEEGIIRTEVEFEKKIKPKTKRYLRLKENTDNFLSRLKEEGERLKSVKQKEIISYFLKEPDREVGYTLLGKLFGYSVVRALIDKGYLGDYEEGIYRDVEKGWLEEELKSVVLTKAQQGALKMLNDSLKGNEGDVILLHGVSASGKTRIYMQAAEDALRLGKGVLILVPEISLTPQVWGRFKSKFGDQVAVLHSQLSMGQRYDNWRQLRKGERSIALGVRSAVFAPVKNLGLIVVDEEQDSSYKQDEPSPSYHARDVAIMRAKLEKATVVLGSATPSMESYYKARQGEYKLFEMPLRVTGGTLPQIKLIDLREERKKKNFTSFSYYLRDKFSEQSERGQQTILLLNRRGYASYLQCPECGYIAQCPDCDIQMTYHINDLKLRCHYCGHEEPAPDVCPRCQSTKIRYKGRGTQRIEQDLLDYFGDERIIRMDQDVTAGGRSAAELLDDFSGSPGTVLVGTQMIAKGLDFPGVTLVGVINADIGLSLPDFRSAERIFQLLMQVSGRAGRGKEPGEVVIQTYNPNSYALELALRHDYKAFFEKELMLRKEKSYPPFTRMLLITAVGDKKDSVVTRITALARDLKEVTNDMSGIEIMGPAPAPFERIKGKFRWQLIIKGNCLKGIYPILKVLVRGVKKGVRLNVNVDPYNIL